MPTTRPITLDAWRASAKRLLEQIADDDARLDALGGLLREVRTQLHDTLDVIEALSREAAQTRRARRPARPVRTQRG